LLGGKCSQSEVIFFWMKKLASEGCATVPAWLIAHFALIAYL